MQASWLPEKVCNRLDKLNRDFLWSHNPDIRKTHLVGWKKVRRSKKENGLGIRMARLNNEALLAKLCWRILKGENCVWSELIRAKYLKNSRLSEYTIRPYDSPTWKGIVRCMALISAFIRWKIGDGRSISFWFDNWLGSGRLCDVITRIEPTDIDVHLVDLIDGEGLWNLSLLSTHIPTAWRGKIPEFKVQLQDVEDRRLWSESANGAFSCQTAYKTLLRTYTTANRTDVRLDWIWKIPCNMKLKYFIWLASQISLATNQLMKIRKMTLDASCDLCPMVEESVVHILRDCKQARKIWRKVVPASHWQNFMHTSETKWLHKNLVSKDNKCVYFPLVPWKIIFAACIWFIWKARNHRMFRRSEEECATTFFHIKTLVNDLMSLFYKRSSKRKMAWIKPPPGWLKLNTDGRVLEKNNRGAAGGVLRNDHGDWIWVFVSNIAQPSVLEAEIEAIRIGLSIAWEQRIAKLEIENDSREAYLIITEGSIASHPLKNKIEECRILLHKPWMQKFIWIAEPCCE